ncbi:MAG: hypothetical protein HYX39_08575 [Bacteroidetes bacterium]|nr:hypothetical protein [Bacteroidota bacterium]
MLELYKNGEADEAREMSMKPDLEIPFIKPELSMEECRKILNTNGEQYSDEEISEIRTLILNMVEIDYKMYQKRKTQAKKGEAKLIQFSPEETNYNKAA